MIVPCASTVHTGSTESVESCVLTGCVVAWSSGEYLSDFELFGMALGFPCTLLSGIYASA